MKKKHEIKEETRGMTGENMKSWEDNGDQHEKTGRIDLITIIIRIIMDET